VVFIHGMLGASFAYRKLLPGLARRGIRAITWDLPGFGFTDRPRDFDYSWAGLGRFSVDAVDALRLDRFHLVVHDVGGPIGFELAAARPAQVLSLTLPGRGRRSLTAGAGCLGRRRPRDGPGYLRGESP